MFPRSTSFLALAAVAVTLSAVACSDQLQGIAIPQQTSVSPATTASPPASDRPRKIRMDNLDPCTFLTEEQRTEFMIDRPLYLNHDWAFNSKVCDLHSQKDDSGISLYPITSRGVDAFAPGKVRGESKATRVAGFPAFEVWIDQPPGNQFCTVNVDVADGQVLRSHTVESGRYENPLGRAELCRRAARGAELTLITLQKR